LLAAIEAYSSEEIIPMRFVWFWTFWHWSREGVRTGALLRSPLQGVASHWDEWYAFEAPDRDRGEIEATGRTEANQRQFIAWIVRHWSKQAGWPGNRAVPCFVLGELASVPPFNAWPALAKFRRAHVPDVISAIVLAGDSLGEAGDVRSVGCVALPVDTMPGASDIVAEHFRCDPSELNSPREAALNVCNGTALLVLLELWLGAGRRPYPSWLHVSLCTGWVGAGGLILYLRYGPEPGVLLSMLVVILIGIWAALIFAAAVPAAVTCCSTWREGRRCAEHLKQSQLRLSLSGGLALKGASAGLPFCLAMLIAVKRTQSRRGRAWLWKQLFRNAERRAAAFAATGIITPRGWVKPVVLEPKLRACMQRDDISTVIIPRQLHKTARANAKSTQLGEAPGSEKPASIPAVDQQRVGYAAELPRQKVRSVWHVAEALMHLGGLFSRRQIFMNMLAVIISSVVLFAFADQKRILLPPTAPNAVPPAFVLPNHLSVSLDTDEPEAFQLVFESSYWANRRAHFTLRSGATTVSQADVNLHRLADAPNSDMNLGTIWIERRNRFLNREYTHGERVGRYSYAYLKGLRHE
jgi:hypothetical protein